MFGISGTEFIVLLVVAAIVLGPERLPHYAQQLGRLVRELRRMAQGASEQVRAELGPEFDDIDWRKLDPRQYDPRRIVREALSDAWDPDDPMGLKGAGLDQVSLKKDLGTIRDVVTGAAGPAAGAEARETGTDARQNGSREARETPAFDEDAT